MFLPPEKNEILDVLSSYYKIEQLRAIFKAAFERKQRGYYRMLGYKNLDQCRRAYMIEFFGENLTSKPTQCCDNDSELKPIHIINSKKVKRKMDYKEKLQNIFK